ncbi:MAG: hypothetical protein K2M17_03985 [Bacilli bacterium]|nr:hypothetical protein [Bacilli bacterium]
MKLKYKILLIVLVGGLITVLINSELKDTKISLVAIGDGVSLGMTSYNVVGYSYNDYLMEEIENRHKLQSYNNEFSIENQTVDELYDALEKNTLGQKTKLPLKQIIAKADILTINVGMDEFIDYSIKDKLTEERIEKFLQYYVAMLKSIRSFYDKDIIVLGLYSAYHLDKNTVFTINKEISSIAAEYKAKFLDISALAVNSEYYSNEIGYYMNYKGHKAIYKLLLNLI